MRTPPPSSPGRPERPADSSPTPVSAPTAQGRHAATSARDAEQARHASASSWDPEETGVLAVPSLMPQGIGPSAHLPQRADAERAFTGSIPVQEAPGHAGHAPVDPGRAGHAHADRGRVGHAHVDPARTVDARPAGAAGAPHEDDDEKSHESHLFGRGLLYVIIWSLQLVAGTVVSPILAHLLGVGDFGALSTAQAVYQVVVVLALLGLDQALVLQHAEDGNARTARGLAFVGIVVAFLVTGLALLSVPLWAEAAGFGTDHRLLTVVLIWTAPSAAVQVMLALLLAEDRFRAFATTSVVSAVGGQLIGLTLLLTMGGGALTYAFGSVISQSLAMVLAVVFTRPRVRGLLAGPVTKKAVAFGIPLALSSLAYFVLNAGDRIVLQRLIGPDAVGQYQVAYVVGSAVILMLSFTNGAWAPHFAQMRDEAARYALAMTSRDEIYRLLNPIVLAVTLVTPFAMPILVPESFDPTALTIVVYSVALTAFPAAAAGASGRLLTIERKAKTLGVTTAIAAAVNIGLNFALVPFFGILGAAIATVIAYSLMAALQLAALPKRVPWRGAPPRLVLSVLAVVVVAGATTALPQTLGWNLARVAVALACLPWFFRRLAVARRGPVGLAPEGPEGPEGPEADGSGTPSATGTPSAAGTADRATNSGGTAQPGPAARPSEAPATESPDDSTASAASAASAPSTARRRRTEEDA